ncbi:DUF1707 domain-containing protein [Nocardiopsis sp. NPDC058789]|uniref:DUF1707 and DUF2154 domain-containing protein n=1 Tax=Nocardiopsis eucommiae TaxID=2831970 RepID=A0A975L9E6_9ACTN|nr:DUF1707 and DUF2154 domain-containing protein [Nocardiopsis eucommiae]
MRASDSDRERVGAVLRSAVTDGRIDMEEFEERLERAETARTLGELPELTADLLPAEEQPLQLDPEPMVSWFTTLRRRGRWVAVPGEQAGAVCGRAEIDMREALLTHNHHRMTVSAFLGRVVIDVPEGVEVRLGGWSFLGRRSTNARRGAASRPPVLEIDGFCLFGTVRVRAPRRRLRLVRRRARRQLGG